MSEPISPALLVDAELVLANARVQLVRLNHVTASTNMFCREGVYWIDLCLTPRRPSASACYIDRWSAHRSAELGALIALPPGQRLELHTAGGRHASLICQLSEASVERFLPDDFEWTDRRLEACLSLTNAPVRTLLLRLNYELKTSGLAIDVLCEAIITQLAVELARHLVSVSEPNHKGGLASWRQRIIDDQVQRDSTPPTLAELAKLCRLSDRQLRRGFKASRGCHLGEYLGQMRIESAKRKLTTADSLQIVAAALGYSSQSTFTAAFRRATGITPGKYRKQFGSRRPI